MKTSDLLKLAKQYLYVPEKPEKMGYQELLLTICGAICTASGNCLATKVVRTEICERLAPHVTVTEWLHAQGFVSKSDLCSCTPEEQQQIQQFRLRWLEHLIVEYKAKGD